MKQAFGVATKLPDEFGKTGECTSAHQEGRSIHVRMIIGMSSNVHSMSLIVLWQKRIPEQHSTR